MKITVLVVTLCAPQSLTLDFRSAQEEAIYAVSLRSHTVRTGLSV